MMRRRLTPFLLLLAAAGCGRDPVPDTVQVAQGAVRGTVQEDGIVAFKGVPYAAAPIGDLRWRPPAALAVWNDTLDATAYRPGCPQPTSLRSYYQAVSARVGGDTAAVPRLGPVSEDCLFLNIWTPALDADTTAPVMVWIHGGGGIIGSGSEPLFDGTALARRGVVVVTLNYRLGPFGFLAHPALTAEGNGSSGNYGLMDQVAALEWIQQNIAAFGGDPGRVTLFGQSAGASMIAHLMTMPSRGLFHRAILQSGTGAMMRTPLRGPQSGEALGQRLVQALGLRSGATMLQQLRALPADSILRVAFANGIVPDGPVVDSTFVRTSPDQSFAAGTQAVIDVIVGVNTDELATLPFLVRDSVRDFAGWESWVRAQYDTSATALLAHYDTIARRDPAAAQLALLNDELFLAPAVAVATSVAAMGARSWVYLFDAVPAAARAAGLGAFHGAEIPYVFGNDMPGWWQAGEVEQEVSDDIMSYWVGFATHGSPRRSAAPLWPGFTVGRWPQPAQRIGENTAPTEVGSPALNHLIVRVQPPPPDTTIRP